MPSLTSNHPSQPAAGSGSVRVHQLPPPVPTPRERPTASISSIKIMQEPASSPARTCHVHGRHRHRRTFRRSQNRWCLPHQHRFRQRCFTSTGLTNHQNTDLTAQLLILAGFTQELNQLFHLLWLHHNQPRHKGRLNPSSLSSLLLPRPSGRHDQNRHPASGA